jgi:hypothetical protein
MKLRLNMSVTKTTLLHRQADPEALRIIYKLKQIGKHQMISRPSQTQHFKKVFGNDARDHIHTMLNSNMTQTVTKDLTEIIYTATTKRGGKTFTAQTSWYVNNNEPDRKTILHRLRSGLQFKIRESREQLKAEGFIRNAAGSTLVRPMSELVGRRPWENEGSNTRNFVFLKYAGTYTVPNTMLHFFRLKNSSRIFNEKTPSRKEYPGERWVGIEIEACFPNEQKLIDNLVPYSKWVHLKTDGSVRPLSGSGEVGREITICCPTSIMDEVIRGTCAAIHKSKGTVNQTCGLHVHLDAMWNAQKDASGYLSIGEGTRLRKQAAQMFDNLKLFQAIMFKMQPKSRQDNHYTERVKGKFSEQKNRYRAINAVAYGSHGTIEVRVHSGTIDGDKILNWAKMCQRIAYGTLPTKARPSAKLLRTLGCDNQIIDYMNTRIKTFAQAVNS